LGRVLGRKGLIANLLRRGGLDKQGAMNNEISTELEKRTQTEKLEETIIMS